MNDNLNYIIPKGVDPLINKFCLTIGMIPSSYLISLTYEEQVVCIGKFIDEQVIPALNNNADAVAQLQSLFTDLKNYVNNYFNNLDVQDEINNKLDAMVESGEFQEILEEFLRPACVLGFDTVSDMLDYEFKNGDLAVTKGYYTSNDGGGASYNIRTKTQSDVEDNGSIHFLENNLVAELIVENGTVNVKTFGAKSNDNTFNSTNYIQNAIDYAVANNIKDIFIPTGNYYISSIKLANVPTSVQGFTLRGENSFNTILNSVNNNITTRGLVDYTNAKECTLRDIGLRGNKSNQVNLFDGFYVNSDERTTGIVIKNVSCGHFTRNGFYINSSNHYIISTLIDNCSIFSNNENGLYMDRMTDSKVVNSDFFQNKKHGLVTLQSSNHFNNDKFYLNGQFDGVTTDPTITPAGSSQEYLKRYSACYISSSRNIFTNCECQENYGHGFEISGCTNNVLVGCIADANGICGFDDQGNRITRADYNEEAVYSGFVVDRCSHTEIIGNVSNFIQGSQGTSQKNAITIDTSSNTIATLTVSDTPNYYNLKNVSFKSTVLTFNNKIFDTLEIPNADAFTVSLEGATVSNKSHVRVVNNSILYYDIILTFAENIPQTDLEVLQFKTGYRPAKSYANGYVGICSNQFNPRTAVYNEINTSGIVYAKNNESNKKAIVLNGYFFI